VELEISNTRIFESSPLYIHMLCFLWDLEELFRDLWRSNIFSTLQKSFGWITNAFNCKNSIKKGVDYACVIGKCCAIFKIGISEMSMSVNMSSNKL